ncbi:MAG: hypothetical protein JXX14_07005 [Deltaproteobacteria bacterium]|nr:hypothetical protein [Deltaproteobacteria bacterium]
MLYFNSFDSSNPESNNASEKDNLIAGTVAERIDELNVKVQQITLPRGVQTHDDAYIARVLECSKTAGLGCFWISESMGGFDVHLVFFDSPDTWKLERHMDSQELAVLAESTAMVVKNILEGILKQPEQTSSDLPENANPVRSKKKDEAPIPKPRPASKVARFRLPVSLSGGYSIAFLAKDIEPSKGIEGELTYLISEKLSVFASYTGNWLSILKNNQGHLKLRLHPVHLGLRYSHFTGRFAFALGAAVGCIPVESNSLSGAFSSNYKEMDIQWSYALGLRVSVGLTKWLSLYLGATADILIPPLTYEDEQLKFWPVMPRFQTGVSFGRTGLTLK